MTGVLTALSFIISGLHLVLIGIISFGWLRLKIFTATKDATGIKVTVIVACRNEETNMGHIISDLSCQEYPADDFEVLIVDDHSTDKSIEVVEKLAGGIPAVHFRILSLPEGSRGKKSAISMGVQEASGELVLTTDADCRIRPAWIREYAAFYIKHRPAMVLGPVMLSPARNLFQKLQAVEFMSLAAATAGSCHLGFPVMANGANLAFTKEAFLSVNGYHDNRKYASGDDMFLMMSIRRKFGKRSVQYLKSMGTIVTTHPENSAKAFWSQRFRWVSKSRGYKSLYVLMTGSIVLAMNAWLLFMLAASCTGYIQLFLGLFLLKLITDLPVLAGFAFFLERQRLLWLTPLVEILNCAYTVVAGIGGNLVKVSWKGRRV